MKRTSRGTQILSDADAKIVKSIIREIKET